MLSSYYRTTKKGRKQYMQEYLHVIHDTSLHNKIENGTQPDIQEGELVHLKNLRVAQKN